MKTAREKKYNRISLALSIILPLVVALLFKVKIDVELPIFLPPIYASINALTAIILVLALVAIKKGNRKLHEQLNTLAIALSVVFLIMYVLYHMTSDSTKFGGEGMEKTIYFIVLISHIILSIAVIPFVLITFFRARLGKFKQHKKIARVTFPLWLYVAVTGVIVYLMISPYYIY